MILYRGRFINKHRGVLRSTYRFGFAGVPNAVNIELILLRLFKVALVLASWRVVLHCSWRNAPFPLRLACCARGRVVLYSAALGLSAALGFVVCVSLLCGS